MEVVKYVAVEFGVICTVEAYKWEKGSNCKDTDDVL